MSHTTLVLAGGAFAAIAIGAGVFGYSTTREEQLVETPSHLTAYQNRLESKCLTTMNRAVGTHPLLKIYLGGRIKSGCGCMSRELLTGRSKKEAYLISNLIPLKLNYQLVSEIEMRGSMQRPNANMSENKRKLLRKRMKRARAKLLKKYNLEMRKIVGKSGLGPKRALKLLDDANVQGRLCLARGMAYGS